MASKAFLEKAYLAYFGRPVDPTGAVAFANSTEAEVAAAFSASPESQALFGPTFGAAQINLIYLTLFGRPAEAAGVSYWLNEVARGALTTTGVSMGILAGARNADITFAANKLAASALFTTNLDTAAEIQGYSGNDAASAARDFLKSITSTVPTQTQVNVAVQDTCAIGNNTVGQLFTLTESLSAAKVGTPAVMGPVMWGYNPHSHAEGTTAVDNTGAGTVNQSGVISNPSSNAANLSNEGPSDGGIPVADLISFLTTITGLDLKELGLVDASGQQTFANVTSLTISNAVAGGSANNAGSGTASAIPVLTVGYADGSSMNAEVALGAGYMKFLNDLLFDAQGNSRLYQNVITPATSGSNAALQAIKLTPSLNNGGTLEVNITTTKGDDTIVAGRLELLQGAYIDGGAGYNILEIDAKGTYAQPAELLRIQEIRVNDLPNWYTTTGTINGSYAGPANTNSSTDLNGALNNGYLNNSSYPQLSTVSHTNDSWLDLSRATALKKLVITDGGTTQGGAVSGSNQTSGNLTIVGIRNAGVEGNVTRLEGSFPDTLNLQYGQGQTGTLSLELALGDVTGSINLLQNAAVLNIDSQGVVNHMHNFFAGGSISRMVVKGAGEFAIDQNIASSFNANTAVVIDATANTGGLNINFDASMGEDFGFDRFASVTVKGTSANDVLSVTNVRAYTGDQVASNNGATTTTNGKVTIDAGAGDNVVVTDGSSIVKVTTGSGDDTIFSKNGEVITILAGDGSNVINTDSSKIVTITSGAGVDNISSLNSDAVIITAGDGNNIITTDGSKTVSITTGTGNDNISSTGSVSVVIDAGVGNNTIKASATSAVNITTGAGNDKITAVGNDITIMSGGGNDVITISGTDASFGVVFRDGALLNINTGTTGSATINFGNDQTAPGFGNQLAGVTALDGSVVAGCNVKLYIDSPTNLTQADLTGLTGNTKVVLEGDRDNARSASNPLGNDTLRITADQFKQLGAAAFSEHLAGAGAQTGDVYIVLGAGKAFDLSSVTDIASLSANVKLHFELQEGSNLTLTATQLHNYLADNAVTSVTGTNGQTATSPNGTVTLNGVGNSFTVEADGDNDRVFGTIIDANVDNVVITRNATGFNRPADVVTLDTYIIDSTGTAPLVITSAIVSEADILKITGNQDVQFKGVVDLGGEVSLGGKDTLGAETDAFTVDFSALTGKVTGLTLDHFQDVKAIRGNGLAGTRIDVIVNENVGSAGVNKGLNTSGVETYMVTKIDADQDGAPDNAGIITINLCDLTQDVKFIGLKGNAGSTLVLNDVPWGKVAPHIVLEGDGYANASEALKVDGSPDTSDVGSITAIYNTGGAYAVVDINNGGVELGVTALGAERKFVAGTVTLTGATSATVNVAQGDVTIAAIAGNTLASVKFVATEDVTVTAALPALLKTIDASGVTGAFKAILVDPVDHATVITGGAGLLDLTLSSFNPTSAAEAGSSITGGTGLAKLTLTGSSDLSKTTLTNVDKVVVGNDLAVTLTLTQAAAIAFTDITTTGVSATLNLVGLDNTLFAVSSLSAGIKIGTVTLAANAVVTLDPATNLTGVTTLFVPNGTTLNLTAAQFQQLTAHTITGSGVLGAQGTVNITGLKQADITALDLNGDGVFTGPGEHGSLNLGGITGVKMGTVTLSENVTLKATDSLGTFKNVVMGDGLTLALGEINQANGLKISGGANTVLQILDTDLAGTTGNKIDASGLNVTTIKLVNTLVKNQNVDAILDHLPGSVVKEIYNDTGFTGLINQVVTIDAGTTVGGNLTFNPITSDTELRSLTLNLSGGTEISGTLNLATTVKVIAGADQLRTHLETLTINSTGTAANLLNGKTANTITGNITPAVAGAGTTENNLLNVVINAAQALVVQGDVVFSSVVGDDTYTGNDNFAAIATLTVNGTANVSLGTVDTSDDEVDGLQVVNAGSGTLSLTLDAAKLDQVVGTATPNNDALSFTGTGAIALTVKGAVNLSDDVLTAVNKITIADNGTLTLSQAQLNALGAAQLATDGTPVNLNLNIVNLGSTPFDATTIPGGINVASVTLAAGTTTLAATTNLTGVDKIVVPEGSTLNLTAAQFQQLQGKGVIVGLDTNGVADGDKFTLNITDLKQADVEHSDTLIDTVTGTAGFSLDGVQSNAAVNISLGESSVTMGKYSALGVLSLPADLLVGATLTNTAKFTLTAGQTLSLVDAIQANGLVVNGAANSTLVFKFASLAGSGLAQINAAGYSVTTLKALAVFVGGTDVEQLLLNVPSSVVELYYADSLDLGFVSGTNRIAVVDAGVIVPGFLMYNDLQATQEVRTLDLTLSGGSKIVGDVDLSTTLKPSGGTNPVQRYLDSVTIHSKGTATNVITGNLTATDPDGALAKIENNLLNITLDATQKLVVGVFNPVTNAYVSGGNIVFTSVTDAATANLNITGTAAVTVHGLDATDNTNNTILTTAANEPDIDTLVINNSGTGLFTATGGTAAITGSIENLVLKGTGAMAFGTNMVGGVVNAEGLTSATISSIDASGLSGALSLGIVNDVDSAAFAFKAGSGVTSLSFSDAVLSSFGADGVAGGTGVNADTAGWSFDFSNAGVGSMFHLNAVYDTADKGSLNIKLGANTTLYIDQSMDLTKMGLSITQVKDIVLADGAVLTLTAAQANALHIVAGVDTGAVGITAKVNIIDLGTAAVDFSHIGTNIAGTVTLAASDVALALTTDLGDFTVQLLAASTSDATLAGQTVRFATTAQADNAVSVVFADGTFGGPIDGVPEQIGGTGNSSTNVVWLFNSMTGPVDTSKYDPELGRLLFNAALVNSFGGQVENMFTTLPSTILRVDFATTTVLNNLLSSTGVDRTMEFSNFTSVGNLTYSDIGVSPVEHLHSLNLVLGGQVTVGNVLIDDIIPAAGYNPLGADQFTTLTVDSKLALTSRTASTVPLLPSIKTNYLASESYVNNNDGVITSGVETAQPNNINTVGNIGVGAANGLDLFNVDLKTNGVSVLNNTSAGDGAKLNVGTITFGYVPTAATPTQTAILTVSGANDVNITSVNTNDADITALTVNTTGYTGTLTAPGASPALKLDNTQTLTFVNDLENPADNAQVITLGSATNAGVAGNELSIIDASNFDGTLNLGVLAQLDSNNDDKDLTTAGNDGLLKAVTFTSGHGITTATLAAGNGLTPTLLAGSEWSFTYTGSKPGSYLKITPTVVFNAGSTLTLKDVPVVIEGDVNLTQLVDNVLTVGTTEGLFVTGGAIQVLAGSSLTLSPAQVRSLALVGVDIFGAGTVKLVGDASNFASLGANLKTVGVDLSGVTLIASPATGFDMDATVFLTLDDANIGTNAVSVAAGHTVIGSANIDNIAMTGFKADTITGGAGNDIVKGGFGDDTYNVDAGTDTIVGLASSDILVVSAGATALATVTAGFYATAATVNNGTAVLTGGSTSGVTPIIIDVSQATGANGFTLNGGTSDSAGLHTLIGSSKGDIINGGNSAQMFGAQDTLTGNGGADKFVFNLAMNSAASMTSLTTQAAVDEELITITADGANNGNETFQVKYTVGTDSQVTVNMSLGSVDASNGAQVATFIATQLDNMAKIGAFAVGNVIHITGDDGAGLTIDSVTASNTAGPAITTLAGAISNGTDVAQISTLTIAGTPTAGDVYNLSASLSAGGSTTPTTYTAAGGNTSVDVAAGLAGAFNGGGFITKAYTGGSSVITFTDAAPDNGGFTLNKDATAAFGGSGASGNLNTGALLNSADTITDFATASDTISFGLAGGVLGSNFLKAAAAVADFGTAKAAADVAFNGTVQYYLVGDTFDGYGLLFVDANLDGSADLVVKLVGTVTAANFATAFAAGDIV